MGNTYYIAAIELSSSKISGAVGIETTEGMRILATASTPVEGFISKGIVRNVDKTSEAITGIVNMLENDLSKAAQEDIVIKKAYISFAGLSMHSIKSKVARSFGNYIKITQDIIDGMGDENRETFQAPNGYKRLQVETLEYKLDGNTDFNPIGAPTQHIECNYLNIVMKEQFYAQLRESFAQAGIEIEESLCAANFDADILLSKDLRRNGCALVNIGAETTTISIYGNDKPKMLTVLPLGSNNITRDLTAERISLDKADVIKFARGYNSTATDNDGIDNETVNNVIYARVGEILKNVRYQLEESGERVHHIVFTGGGSKLKNLTLLLKEFMPDYSTEIKPEPQLNIVSESGVNVNVITTALYGLLKQGKINCCETVMPAAQENGEIFTQNEMEGKEEMPVIETPAEDEELQEDERRKAEEERIKKEQEEKKAKEEEEEEKRRKEEEKHRKEEKKRRQKEQRGNIFGSLFDAAKAWVNNATSEDENAKEDND